jgi:hypothetical protein
MAAPAGITHSGMARTDTKAKGTLSIQTSPQIFCE